MGKRPQRDGRSAHSTQHLGDLCSRMHDMATSLLQRYSRRACEKKVSIWKSPEVENCTQAKDCYVI